MPELPEVETVRRDLADLIVGRRISAVGVLLDKMVRGSSVEEFESSLIGQTVVDVGRRAKLLLLHLDDHYLMFHLKMSGRLIYQDSAESLVKHTHIVFSFDNGFDLRFIDMRQFGFARVIPGAALDDAPELAALGPEPLDPSFSREKFQALVASKAESKRSIKGVLLDQSFISGIGNLYADEILHEARVDPARTVGSISPSEAGKVYRAMRSILIAAIEQRGTSFDLYVDARGRRGRYLDRLKIYGRAGEPCATCGGPVVKVRIAGRGTHFCPRCQS